MTAARQWRQMVVLMTATGVVAAGCATTMPRAKPTPKANQQTADDKASKPGDLEMSISRLVQQRLSGKKKEPIHTLILGNVALVGIGDGTPTRPSASQTNNSTQGGPAPAGPNLRPSDPTNPPTQGTAGVPPTDDPTYTPKRSDIDVLPRTIASEVMRRFPQIVQVQSTDDGALVGRIKSVASQVRAAKPVHDRADEIAYLFRMTSPLKTTPSSRTGGRHIP